MDSKVPNNNEEYSKYIRKNSDKSSNKDAVGLAVSSIIASIIVPIAFVFCGAWLLFGGLSGNETKYWTVLIIGIIVLIISLLLPFIFTYKLAKKDSSAKDKKIFAIGLLFLIISIILFYFLYIKK
jgi:uncharacterized membrane protein